MVEFEYGDPHPLGTDRLKKKREADQRAAKHYANKLAEADALFIRDREGVAESLCLFDREEANCRHWQGWASCSFSADPNDAFAAEMCRDYALNGGQTASFRLPLAVRAQWLE